MQISTKLFSLRRRSTAGAAIARAEKARALQEAVARLKAVLTPEQMDMARQMQAKLVERIAHFIAARQRQGGGVPLRRAWSERQGAGRRSARPCPG